MRWLSAMESQFFLGAPFQVGLSATSFLAQQSKALVYHYIIGPEPARRTGEAICNLKIEIFLCASKGYRFHPSRYISAIAALEIQ